MSQIGKPPGDEGAILRGGAASRCGAAARRWTLVAAILGSSMAFVDGTVVNVALPALQRELGATAAEAQWIIESYALFLAALLLVGGVLGDRFGRRRIFMIGVALFTAASVACALAGSAGALIGARAFQGLGAALLVPGSLALISATFPEAERGRAIGTWSAFSGITAAVGPVLGGFLIEHVSWTWAFLLNVPIGLALLVALRRQGPGKPRRRRRPSMCRARCSRPWHWPASSLRSSRRRCAAGATAWCSAPPSPACSRCCCSSSSKRAAVRRCCRSRSFACAISPVRTC